MTRNDKALKKLSLLGVCDNSPSALLARWSIRQMTVCANKSSFWHPRTIFPCQLKIVPAVIKGLRAPPIGLFNQEKGRCIHMPLRFGFVSPSSHSTMNSNSKMPPVGDVNFSQVFNILKTAESVINTDDNLEFDSLLLEPTPIGPNGIQCRCYSRSFSNDDAAKSFCCVPSELAMTLQDQEQHLLSSDLVALFSNKYESSSSIFADTAKSSSHIMNPDKVKSLEGRNDASAFHSTLPPMKRQRIDHSVSALLSFDLFCCKEENDRSFTHFKLAQPLQEEDSRDTKHADGHRFRQYQSDQWTERFQDLVAFKQRFGHALVPHGFRSNQHLAQWTKRQRYQYKLKQLGQHSTLTDARQEALEEMGFVWDSHRASWFERLEALKEFRKVHGHCNVPSNFEPDRSLAVWVKCQRRQVKLYKKGSRSTMNEERYAALEALGFDWNPRNLTAR